MCCTASPVTTDAKKSARPSLDHARQPTPLDSAATTTQPARAFDYLALRLGLEAHAPDWPPNSGMAACGSVENDM